MKIDTSLFKLQEIGVLPFIFAIPFMYYPKLLEGDTQPWILLSALIAFFTFRTYKFFNNRDLAIVFLALLCIFIYAVRSESVYLSIRNTHTYLVFILLWIVIRRGDEALFIKAIKMTVVIWFCVGLAQFVSDKLGYQIEVSGRWYKIGRQGPPSITAEASFYGSISVICMMYLISDKWKGNLFYISLAFFSILISGSFLSILLLIFPVMKLPLHYKVLGLIILPLAIFADYYFGMSGVSTRIDNIFASGLSLSGMFQDPSLNMRAGHIYFTLFERTQDSLFYLGDINFYKEYNVFANSSDLFVETGSDFILPALGEMVYGNGVLALFLVIALLRRTSQTCSTTRNKIMKMGFVFACLLNPITISNPFLILYINKKDER